MRPYRTQPNAARPSQSEVFASTPAENAKLCFPFIPLRASSLFYANTRRSRVESAVYGGVSHAGAASGFPPSRIDQIIVLLPTLEFRNLCQAPPEPAVDPGPGTDLKEAENSAKIFFLVSPYFRIQVIFRWRGQGTRSYLPWIRCRGLHEAAARPLGFPRAALSGSLLTQH